MGRNVLRVMYFFVIEIKTCFELIYSFAFAFTQKLIRFLRLKLVENVAKCDSFDRI